MPKKRLPRELWSEKRRQVYIRDGGLCQSPPGPHKQFCSGTNILGFNKCHIDHIVSGKLGNNRMDNLRLLCPICHALRNDFRHRGLTSKYLAKGLLPVNWRLYLWE